MKDEGEDAENVQTGGQHAKTPNSDTLLGIQPATFLQARTPLTTATTQTFSYSFVDLAETYVAEGPELTTGVRVM